jgi:hypothetical protein
VITPSTAVSLGEHLAGAALGRRCRRGRPIATVHGACCLVCGRAPAIRLGDCTERAAPNPAGGAPGLPPGSPGPLPVERGDREDANPRVASVFEGSLPVLPDWSQIGDSP